MRLKNIVLTELIYERLVCYEELERAMNKKTTIEKSKLKIRHHLAEIVKLNGMISEWETINETEINKIINE